MSASSKGTGTQGPPAVSYLTILLRRWKLIVGTVVGAVLIAIPLTLLRRELYSARIVLFQNQANSSPMSALAGRLPAGLLGVDGRGTDSGQLIGLVLRSRTLADSLQRRAGGWEDVEINQGNDGSIVIVVTDEDAEQAARVANEYPVVINDLISDIGFQGSARRQELLERQLLAARQQLETVEERLLAFERSEGAGQLDEQATASLQTALRMQQEIIEQEVRISQLSRTATPDNPELRAAVAELEARRAQLRRLRGGSAGSSMLLSLEESPELKVEATRILREYTEAETVYSSLRAALASSQIETNNTMPAVEVLDAALVPLAPTPTRTGLILTAAALLAFFLVIGSLLTTEALRRARQNQKYSPLFDEWDDMKGQIGGYLPWRRNAGKRGATDRSVREPRPDGPPY